MLMIKFNGEFHLSLRIKMGKGDMSPEYEAHVFKYRKIYINFIYFQYKILIYNFYTAISCVIFIISHSKEIYLLESTQSLLISYNFCESILNQFSHWCNTLFSTETILSDFQGK